MDMVERVVAAIKAELVAQGGAGGNWTDGDAEPAGRNVSFGLDGHFDLQAVARAALDAVWQDLAPRVEFDEEGILERIGRAAGHFDPP